MIDPYHLYLARRPSVRTDPKSNSKQSPDSNPSSSSASASKSSSVDSKSQQSSYIGGDGLSPTSTTSTDPATKASLGGSSSSSGSALQHRLPEFEHFRQSSPLMPEFYPRTSEFFSRRRRRSSVAVPSTDGAGVESGDSANQRGGVGGGGAKKPHTFHLPATFEESESMVGEQLPVRLGLAPPSHIHGLEEGEVTYKARVAFGYYFYTPPPVKSASSTSAGGVGIGKALGRRRNTDTSDNSAVSQGKLVGGAVYSTSPAADSPVRGRASSSHSSLPGSTLVGHTTSQPPRTRLPPPSPDCWHPDSYFSITRSRVKGKMRDYIHHAFPSSVVPYWHGYNTETIEAEMSTHLNVNAALHGNTLREFPEGSRPCRVLDLGCGRGVWCLDMAREWKTSEFVGLDIVPIQPPLQELEDADLEHRVSWVIANLLEPLPFPDASFDYVHIRFILQGVPEDKWVDIFSEARRILAPGGVLEVVEGNYSFFGHASLVDVQELKDLEQGRAAKKGSGVKLPKRLKVLNDSSDSADVDAIEVVLERMMHRRFINPTPLSVVPSALLLPGFSNVANGNPRHIPVYVESSAQRARSAAAAEGEKISSGGATSSEDEGKRQGRFTSRGQIGKPLNSQFAMTDPDLFCALVILQQLDHFSSSRELIWAEAEEEKRSLQGQPQPELAKMDTNRRFCQGNPAALRPFAHPWKSKDQFFSAMDAWIDATRASADTEHMLRKYLGWESVHEDLTVEGRKFAERRRKMSVTTADPGVAGLQRLGGLGLELDQLVLAESAVEEDILPQEARGDAETGSAFAVSTTHAQEAPAGLQTTRASAPDTTKPSQGVDTTDNDTLKASSGGKKSKKKVKRPSSSGAGVTSPNSVTTSPGPGGGFGRTRAFGRGSAGGSSTLPVPLPEASAFMASYAFASPATDPVFRGPATKVSIIASSRNARIGSTSGKSFSDRSSTSGKTEREKDDAIKTRKSSVIGATAAPPQQQEKAEGGMSAAAAYAATQRVSHGLEEEYRMTETSVDGEGGSRRPSRPVSPTSTVPAAAPTSGATTLGNRPPQPGPDSCSVSIPANMLPAASGGTVRIAEPTMRPSRSRSKSSAKAVAMIGFYDCTGFLATA
ncbi:hypothetical protein NDA14_004724 [Ustilago hordei]|nr:hypothetical protein NDA14_004724 [Ustilago hordei]UTT93133.1 hypothetical protein NDA17_000978 [Ustilago hordei]